LKTCRRLFLIGPQYFGIKQCLAGNSNTLFQGISFLAIKPKKAYHLIAEEGMF